MAADEAVRDANRVTALLAEDETTGEARALKATADGELLVSGAGGGAGVGGHNEDAAHSSGAEGVFILGVRNDADAARTSADGDYSPISVDSAGRLKTTATVTINSEFAEDAAHSSGATGSFVLGVRNDAGASRTSADGDYSPISTDSAGRVGISDLGGSVTVDGTVEIGATSLAALESITVQNGAGGSAVNIQDGGNSITVDGTVATNAEKAEDAAHSSGATGNFILAVRNDADSAMTSADGDYSPIAVDSAGRLKLAAGVSATFNAEKVEDAAHSSGATGAFILAVRNDADAALTSADGDYSPIAVDSAGRLKSTTSVTVNAEKAEDAAHSSGATGNFVLAVRNDASTAMTSADGDYSPIAVDSAGRVSINDGGGSITIDGTVAISSTVDAAQKTEDNAASSGATGYFILAVRNDAAASVTSTDGDYSQISVDSAGRVMTVPSNAGNSNAASGGTGTKSNVSGSASSVTVLASNTSRKQATIWNDSSAVLYLDLTGGTASSTSCSVKIPADGYYEVPAPVPTNAITGIWASATGSARVTEFA